MREHDRLAGDGDGRSDQMCSMLVLVLLAHRHRAVKNEVHGTINCAQRTDAATWGSDGRERIHIVRH